MIFLEPITVNESVAKLRRMNVLSKKQVAAAMWVADNFENAGSKAKLKAICSEVSARQEPFTKIDAYRLLINTVRPDKASKTPYKRAYSFEFRCGIFREILNVIDKSGICKG